MNKKLDLVFALISFLMLNSMCFAQNPLNFGSNIRTADPSGHVWKDGRMYLYTSHDEECQPDFYMKDWYVFSSADLFSWKKKVNGTTTIPLLSSREIGSCFITGGSTLARTAEHNGTVAPNTSISMKTEPFAK